MIETFTVKNYRSYRDKAELSFVASKKEGSKTNDLPPIWYKEINGKRILRLLLCVGLNGTGKSQDVFCFELFANDCNRQTAKAL